MRMAAVPEGMVKLSPRSGGMRPATEIKVAVFGGGSFGTAMACTLGRKGIQSTLVVRKPDVVEQINENHVNPYYQTDLLLPESVKATLDAEAAFKEADFIFHAVPVQYSRGALEKVRHLIASPSARDLPSPLLTFHGHLSPSLACWLPSLAQPVWDWTFSRKEAKKHVVVRATYSCLLLPTPTYSLICPQPHPLLHTHTSLGDTWHALCSHVAGGGQGRAATELHDARQQVHPSEPTVT